MRLVTAALAVLHDEGQSGMRGIASYDEMQFN
jgi:hypothetical protein